MKQLIKHRYAFLSAILMLGLFSFISQEDQIDYWYYTNGQEIHWKAQPDVFAFRTLTHTQFAGNIDTSIVEATEYRSNDSDKINLFYFKATATDAAKKSVKDEVKNDAGFEAEFPAVTIVPTAIYTDNLWYLVTDKVLLTFKTDSLASKNWSAVANHYNMNLYNNPVGIAGGNYTYIFTFVPNATNNDGVTLSRNIYIDNNAFMQSAEPDMVKIYRQPVNNGGTTGIASTPQSTDDFYVVNEQEHILHVYYVLHKTNEDVLSLKVFDLFGRQLSAQKANSNGRHLSIDINDLSAGIYFAVMEDASGKPLFTRKFRKL